MRAITVKQPWAWAITYGGKNIENRPWGIHARGPIAIHAGKEWDRDGATDLTLRMAWEAWSKRLPLDPHSPEAVQLGYSGAAGELRKGTLWLDEGAVVAVADLVGSHRDSGCCRPWGQPGKIHLVLANVRRLPEPVPCRGALGPWRLPVNVDDPALCVHCRVTAQIGGEA